MKLSKLVIIFAFTIMSCNQKNASKSIEIEINPNIELLGLAYFIGIESDGIETDTIQFANNHILKKDWHNYGYKLFKTYGEYASSLNLAKSFEVADHLWLD